MSTLLVADYIHELRQAGFTDEQSTVQARRLEQVVAGIKQEIRQEFQMHELVTKKDLELTKKDLNLAIEKLRYETLKFVLWTGVGVTIALSSFLGGLLAKGFHWL